MNGYLTIVFDSDYGDYMRCAKALAKTVSPLSIIIPKGSSYDDLSMFDHVIEMDMAYDKACWNAYLKIYAYDLSPYDNTVLLDADMYIPDTSLMFSGYKPFEMCSKVYTYKGDRIDNDTNPYRLAFNDNRFNERYTALMRFDKSNYSKDVFDMAKLVYEQWDRIKFITPLGPPTDDAIFCYVEKLLSANFESDLYEMIHMKMPLQSEYFTEDMDFMKILNVDHTNGLTIGNYRIDKPFHYHNKRFGYV